MKEFDPKAPLSALEAVACSMMLPEADMMDWQLQFIACEDQEIWCSKHRQGGATKKVWTIRIMLHSLKLAELGCKGEDWYWVSRDIFTAREFIQEFRKMWEPLGLISKANKGIGIMRIRLPCGGWLNAMSSSPNALVGKSGNIVFDEFAIHADQELLWSIGAPGTMHGFMIAALSTPRGKNTFHAKKIAEIDERQRLGKPAPALFKIDLMMSISQGLVRIINRARMAKKQPPLTEEEFLQQCRDRATSEELFQQEYMCIPSDGESSAVISQEDMMAVMLDPVALGCQVWGGEGKLPAPPAGGGEFYAGIDIGNKRDLTVLWLNEMLSTGQQRTRLLVVLPPGRSFESKEAVLVPLLKAWRPRRALADATNAADFVERLQKAYPMVEPFLFSSKTRKQTLGYAIAQVKRQQILVPNRNEIGKDFCSVEAWTDQQGNRDYWIPSRKEEGHGDRFMAAALAMWAAEERAKYLQMRRRAASPPAEAAKVPEKAAAAAVQRPAAPRRSRPKTY